MAGLAAVTGATGFLGRYIVRALIENGWRVRILARRYPVHEQFSDLSFEVVHGDLSDLAALRELARGADVVVHAAGLIKARDADAFHRANVQGTANLIAALNASGAATRLLFVSSITARAPHLSPYAASKRAAEELIRTSLAPPNEWVIVRPCAIYGPWDRETLAVLKAVSHRIALRPGRHDARVSLVHASDAAAAIAALCADGEAGSLFEISDARHDGYLWREITDAAAAALGVRAQRLPLPVWGVRLAGVLGTLAARLGAPPAMLTIEKTREVLHPDWSSPADRQPPKSLWQPQIDLNCGFLETIGWYQAQGWLAGAGKIPQPD